MSKRSGGRRRRRVGLLTATAAVLAGLVFMIVSAGAAVAPSGFQGNDGNIKFDATSTFGGTQDWATLSPAAQKFDDPGGGALKDDSLGKGSKEDDLVPNVVDQSVPQKDDFKNVFLATENVGGKDFLYESSIRVAPNGSANLNVELNQGTGTPKVSSNGETLTRVAGDKLITFDFTAGGTKATITELTWGTSTSNPGATCADSNDSLPCWINQIPLSAAIAEGAANDGLGGRTGDIAVADNVLTHELLKSNTFQEMAINLTDAGILPAGTCTTFASASIKSRSSGSNGTFNSALKDLVLANKTISNCGSVLIHKTGVGGAALAGAGFTMYKDEGVAGTYEPAIDVTKPTGATPNPCTTGDGTGGTTLGDCQINNVQNGNYVLVETTTPAGYSTAAPKFVSVTGGGGAVTEVTFVDTPLNGKIHVDKNDDASPANPVAGAGFTLFKDEGTAGTYEPLVDVNKPSGVSPNPCTTTVSGCDFNDVPAGDYVIVETTTPAGYDPDPNPRFVTIGLAAGGDSQTVTFTDPRLFKVITIVCRKGYSGANPAFSLYKSQVTYDSGTSQDTLASLPAGFGATELAVCQLGGAVHDDVQKGAHSSSISIPTTP
jgi:Prealbumin-like fold domain